MDFLEDHEILIDEQHGFRRKRSCESQLIITADDLAKVLNSQGQSDMTILDFSKAFDKVPHHRLINKLEYYGIRGNTKQWISQFLSNRKQKVLVDGESSDESSVLSGVPQGTVLGPILFLIYINDIKENVNSTVRLFADDCLIYREIKSDEDLHILQEDLNTVYDWSKKWLMDFNVSKCYFMSVTLARKNKKLFQYTMGGESLTRTEINPYLGVEISSDLSWSAHVDKICGKANRILGLLQRNLHHTPRSIKEHSYKALVRPILEYSCSVWSPWQAKNIDKIEAVQKKAARFVLNKPPSKDHSSITNLIRDDLKWETLQERRNNIRLVKFYMINNSLIQVPQSLLPPISSTDTRHGYYIQLQPSVNAYKYSFIPATLCLWNNLSPSAVSSPSLEEFKKRLQTSTQP